MLTKFKTIPAWALLSMVTNGLLILIVIQLLLQNDRVKESSVVTNDSQIAMIGPKANPLMVQPLPDPILGPRHRWTYEQWVKQLEKEALAAADLKPARLTILAGDSLSLWFPPNLLPLNRVWLNQGISGETSTGLLKRLPLLDQTQPDTVFVMIGINDLIKGVSDQTILDNYGQIIKDLRWVHPRAKIVIQSILPHGSVSSTWEKRDRLLAISNDRIRQINQELAKIAKKENIFYLDLHPLFVDEKGDLLLSLTTDGLHLNESGYLVWRSALQLFIQTNLSSISSV